MWHTPKKYYFFDNVNSVFKPVIDLDLTGSQGTTRWSPMDWFVTFRMKAMLDRVPGRATGKTGSRERREKSPDQHKPSGLIKHLKKSVDFQWDVVPKFLARGPCGCRKKIKEPTPNQLKLNRLVLCFKLLCKLGFIRS